MGENTNQIEREMVAERDQLGRNLNALEMKARELGDWRTHYRNHPKVFLGIALGGGLLLGAMARRGGFSRHHGAIDTSARIPRPQSRTRRQLETTWVSVSDALLGVASAKALAFVGSLVPGFNEQVNRTRPGSGANR